MPCLLRQIKFSISRTKTTKQENQLENITKNGILIHVVVTVYSVSVGFVYKIDPTFAVLCS